MDCERVFVELTAAPFPTGRDSDADVERHLLGCAACRRIADALRPCEGQEHEALAPAERRCLPRYRTELKPAAVFNSVAAQPGATACPPDAAAWPESAPAWRRERSKSTLPPQIAAFTLAPRRSSSPLWDIVTFSLLVGAVVLCGWAIGALL